jgi:flavin reductase (DIM6/NTAB) family NADH-FMN oxidoreductase RutF
MQSKAHTWELSVADVTDQVKGVERTMARAVTIATTFVGPDAYGLAVDTFARISLAPPMAMLCVVDAQSTPERLFKGDTVAANILSSGQRDVAMRFMHSRAQPLGDLPWRPGPTGAPVLEGTSAHVELEIEKRMPAYGRTIVVARIVDARFSGLAPLVSLGGRLHDGASLGAAT